MSIFQQLENNKGTVSSKLGKDLAGEVLQNNRLDILKEAAELVCYQLESPKGKKIRAGAAKTVEIVAEKKPEWVVPYLEQMFSALEVPEPQTRWMLFRIYGFCAQPDSRLMEEVASMARTTIREKMDGQLCLVSSADLFLGDWGSLNRECCDRAFPILVESCDHIIMNEHDWIFESFIKMIPLLTQEEKNIILSVTAEFETHSRKATLKRIEKIRSMI